MKSSKIYLVILFIYFCNPIQAQMIANITRDVQTDFATYQPYVAEFTPAIPHYQVEADFSNVTNYSDFRYFFDEIDSLQLVRNHFTVKKSYFMQLFNIYNVCTWDSTPIFVTTDAVLHTYHILYDKILAKIEMQKFIEDLDALTQALIHETEFIYQESQKSITRETARRNLSFLHVANQLLNYSPLEVPELVAALVDSELALISAQDGYYYSPILGNFSSLDYSQFIPRGHYTQNEMLKAYFKTMMWYGWTIFTMEPDLFGNLSERHTLQALLLTQKLHKIQASFQLWENIYVPTVFFVGKTDDPNIYSYYDLALQVYGPDFLTLSADSLANSSLLISFMELAQLLPEPLIPNYITGTFTTYKGFRFMGQRFIPDSYMFAHLVLPEVDRLFPKGLDIMDILGSGRAYTLLDSVYGETSHLNYSNQIQKFRNEFKNKSDSDWAQNLYWNWLYCLMPLLYKKGIGYPYFMQTLAWADKELLTALASWAELRHDTILYAKQSGTPSCVPPGPPRSYVEPNPFLYARLASLVKFTREGLENFDLLPSEFEEKLNLLESLLIFLRNVSIKELENIPLSESDYENIFCFGKVMETLISEVPDPQYPWEKNSDDMAIIADVHTDTNTNQCLEEAVGYPLEIYVIVNEGGVLRLTRGAIFSYYEFLQPISQRLTDEKWRDMLQNRDQPKLPRWMTSFMDINQPDPELQQHSPESLYEKEFSSISKKNIYKPTRFYLHQNYPNPFNPVTTIEFDIPKSSHVTLKIYNSIGEEVAMLVSDILSAGHYSYHWDTSRLSEIASGLYFYYLSVESLMGERESFVESRKMLFIK